LLFIIKSKKTNKMGSFLKISLLFENNLFYREFYDSDINKRYFQVDLPFGITFIISDNCLNIEHFPLRINNIPKIYFDFYYYIRYKSFR
jgi:hypothetical protein